MWSGKTDVSDRTIVEFKYDFRGNKLLGRAHQSSGQTVLNTHSVIALVAAFELNVHQNTGQLPSYSDCMLSEKNVTKIKQ